MTRRRAIASSDSEALWAHHHAEWRSPAQIVSQWREADQTNPALLEWKAQGAWWETLERTGATLLITREYEHLVMAVGVTRRGLRISYLPLPHPSGLAVDRERGVICIASTRNPNQIYELRPTSPKLERLGVAGQTATQPSATPQGLGLRQSSAAFDRGTASESGRGLPQSKTLARQLTDTSTEFRAPLIPIRSWFFPGSLYIHDLAFISGRLHANAVGQNAVVRLHEDGRFERAWWPRCIEQNGQPLFDRNYLQLNSIAAGQNLAASFFSASTDVVSSRRPGHRNFQVDGRGVIFSGRTREPVVRGLTRPHSARLHEGRLWVDNSGYGEVGVVEQGRFTPVARLPGWTRGLCFCQGVAFVGTSRVIPRFRHYAPGLAVAESVCGVHAVDARSGAVLGSLIWPLGNQIFAVDWIPSEWSSGLPFRVGSRRRTCAEKEFFYVFEVDWSDKK